MPKCGGIIKLNQLCEPSQRLLHMYLLPIKLGDSANAALVEDTGLPSRSAATSSLPCRMGPPAPTLPTAAVEEEHAARRQATTRRHRRPEDRRQGPAGHRRQPLPRPPLLDAALRSGCRPLRQQALSAPLASGLRDAKGEQRENAHTEVISVMLVTQ